MYDCEFRAELKAVLRNIASAPCSLRFPPQIGRHMALNLFSTMQEIATAAARDRDTQTVSYARLRFMEAVRVRVH